MHGKEWEKIKAKHRIGKMKRTPLVVRETKEPASFSDVLETLKEVVQEKEVITVRDLQRIRYRKKRQTFLGGDIPHHDELSEIARINPDFPMKREKGSWVPDIKAPPPPPPSKPKPQPMEKMEKSEEKAEQKEKSEEKSESNESGEEADTPTEEEFQPSDEMGEYTAEGEDGTPDEDRDEDVNATEGSPEPKLPHTGWGGVTAGCKEAKEQLRNQPHLIRDCQQVINKLVAYSDIPADTSPRWHLRKFCTRLLTYRSVLPARREEFGRPAILFLPDVSGSCESISRPAMRVCMAASVNGVPGADIIVVPTSDGSPDDISVNGHKIEIKGLPSFSHGEGHDIQGGISSGLSKCFNWYARVIQKYQIRVVIIIGDIQGAWLYEWLGENLDIEKFYWLDDGHNPSQPEIGKPPRAVKHCKFVSGCRDEKSFLDGLKLLIRKGF